jgi:hypothetical protein
LAIFGDAKDPDRVTEDEAAHRRLARTGSYRRGGDDHAGGLVAGQTPDPRHGHGHANSQEEEAEHGRDPAQTHDIEDTTARGLLVGAQMAGHPLGELVWRETLRPFHRVVRVDTHRRGPTSF